LLAAAEGRRRTDSIEHLLGELLDPGSCGYNDIDRLERIFRWRLPRLSSSPGSCS
jgi:hypothetical protein